MGKAGTSVGARVVVVVVVDAIFVAEVVAAVVIETVSGCSRATNTVPSSPSGDCGERLLRFLEVLLGVLGSNSSKV